MQLAVAASATYHTRSGNMISTTQRLAPSSARTRAMEGGSGRPRIEPSGYFRWSYILGQIVAAILLIPAAPVLLLLVIIVRLGSPGAGIYRQIRVGRHGKTFTIYKIRTMRNDAEKKSGPTWATVNDSRLTGIGKFIRSIHLDELPQLLNVVKGDMALVGPRPERPEFTQLLARDVDGYLDRLAVRPGVTGLAQINLPPDVDLDSVRRKLVLDLEYIRIASPGLDFRMMCWTALRLFGFRDSITSIFRLNRSVKLSAAHGSDLNDHDRHSQRSVTPHAANSRNGNGAAADSAGRERRAKHVRPR
jgi:lipopolysaccharide/colanic/teichoic acid biosynthesis glycosyltransferase